MTKKNVKGTASHPGALLICQNLGELTAYEVAGDQILIPDASGTQSSISQSLVVLPGIGRATDAMLKGIAVLGTTAIGVRALRAPDGQVVADFIVLFAESGDAERFAEMRACTDRDHSLYLIPGGDIGEAKSTCFKFDCGLRKVEQPWADEEDRKRGMSGALVLLLNEGADERRC